MPEMGILPPEGPAMSVRVMALVFDADIPAIELQDKKRKISAPTLKLVLLALADHCNDDGDGAYPSLSRIDGAKNFIGKGRKG